MGSWGKFLCDYFCSLLPLSFTFFLDSVFHQKDSQANSGKTPANQCYIFFFLFSPVQGLISHYITNKLTDKNNVGLCEINVSFNDTYTEEQ